MQKPYDLGLIWGKPIKIMIIWKFFPKPHFGN